MSLLYDARWARNVMPALPSALRHLMPIIVFTSYWLLPLLLLLMFNDASYPRGYRNYQYASAYLGDASHIIFAFLISFATAPLVYLQSASGVSYICAAGRFSQPRKESLKKLELLRSPVVKRGGLILGLLFAGYVAKLFLDRRYDPNFRYWWGSSVAGPAGAYFVFIVSLMTLWAIRAVAVLVALAALISALTRKKLVYDPYIMDNCNGLRSLGSLIISIWIFSLTVAVSIFVVFRYGYLGIERTEGIRALALVICLSLPSVAVVPLISCSRAVRKARNVFVKTTFTYSKKRNGIEPDMIEVGNMLAARKEIFKAHTLPVNIRIVGVLALINLLQAAAAVKEIVK